MTRPLVTFHQSVNAFMPSCYCITFADPVREIQRRCAFVWMTGDDDDKPGTPAEIERVVVCDQDRPHRLFPPEDYMELICDALHDHTRRRE